MPDISAVLQTITQNLQTPIYPNGISNPSVAGVQVTIEQGWPIREQLDVDLTAGNAHVSVFPSRQERVMTKFERDFQPVMLTAPTIVLTVVNKTVTVTGTITTPQTVMIVVNGTGYAYAIQANDTLNSIATNTAALIPGASATGNVITISTAYNLIARVSTPYSAGQEIARVDRVFMISIWAPNPTVRAAIGAPVDVYMKQNYRIPLSDGFFGQVFYHNTDYIDQLEKSLIYRQDLYYTIQYPTTVVNNYTSIADPFLNSLTLQPFME